MENIDCDVHRKQNLDFCRFETNTINGKNERSYFKIGNSTDFPVAVWHNVIKWISCLVSDSLIYDNALRDINPEYDQIRGRVKGLLIAMLSIQDTPLSIRILHLLSSIHFFEYRFNIRYELIK